MTSWEIGNRKMSGTRILMGWLSQNQIENWWYGYKSCRLIIMMYALVWIKVWFETRTQGSGYMVMGFQRKIWKTRVIDKCTHLWIDERGQPKDSDEWWHSQASDRLCARDLVMIINGIIFLGICDRLWRVLAGLFEMR